MRPPRGPGPDARRPPPPRESQTPEPAARAAAATNGKVVTHGLGLMRGAVFVPSVGPEDRVAAAAKLKAHCRDAGVWPRAAKGCESLNFEGSYLSQFPLVSAHFWTSDHLSSSSRTVNAFSDRIDR